MNQALTPISVPWPQGKANQEVNMEGCAQGNTNRVGNTDIEILLG